MTGRFGRGGMAASRRSVMRAIPFVLGGLAVGRGAASAEKTDESGPAAAGATSSTAAAFPLAVKRGKRYLVDATGSPFLIHGDTAWSLIAQLTREEVELYLADRQARGFNTILVSLIEHHYANNRPANAYREPPFLEPGNYATPNDAYFAHADWVLRRAAEHGILVLLTPSYVGCCGDGWYDEMVANGRGRLRGYGEYLGRRYRDFTNILWVHSGDANPPRKGLVRAIANGIRNFDPVSLHTAHGAPWSHSIEHWEGEPWLQVHNIYTAHPDAWTYRSVHADALTQYARPERMPFFLIEGVYENERRSTERQLRTQAYQAVLSGAGGQVFGNHPIWHFHAPGYDVPMTWQEALGSPGTQSMTHLHTLLTGVRWWQLRPGRKKPLLIDGLGPEEDRAVAARSADRTFAILYLPSSREITLALGTLAGPSVRARWYDPANGEFHAIGGSPFEATGSRRLRPAPGSNSSGFDDWVLVLESTP